MQAHDDRDDENDNDVLTDLDVNEKNDDDIFW